MEGIDWDYYIKADKEKSKLKILCECVYGKAYMLKCFLPKKKQKQDFTMTANILEMFKKELNEIMRFSDYKNNEWFNKEEE